MSVEIGDIVQLDPELTRDKDIAGCFLVVTKVEQWGVEGYVHAVKTNLELAHPYVYRSARGSFRETGGKAIFKCENKKVGEVFTLGQIEILLNTLEKIESGHELSADTMKVMANLALEQFKKGR